MKMFSAQRQLVPPRHVLWRGVLFLAFAGPVSLADPRPIAMGWPEHPSTSETESKALICADRSLAIVRKSRRGSDGKSGTSVMIELDGVTLTGPGMDRIAQALEKDLRWMAIMGHCSAESRQVAEIFVIAILYQWHERRDSLPMGFRVMCGSQVFKVDPKDRSALAGFGDERPARSFDIGEGIEKSPFCF